MPQLNIFKLLLAIQDKHASYFLENKKTIMNYIDVQWTPQLQVTITDHAIPAAVNEDVESLAKIFP